MKVLLLTDRMDLGGAETHIFDLALGLSRMGVQVTVLSDGGRMAERLLAVGIPHIRCRLATRNPLRWPLLRRRLGRILREGDYDILHAHARIPALLLRGFSRMGVGVVVTAHAAFRPFPLSRMLSYWGEKTIAVSEDLRMHLIRFHSVPPERIRVISNGIELSRFSPEGREAGEGTRILFASRLDRDCSLGAELLCRITPQLLDRLPSLSVTIAGGGNDLSRIRDLASHCNRALRAAGIDREVITVPGAVADMPTLLRRHDIFIGVSRAAMEAAACGCAVLLCGNEGYFGLLTPQNLSVAVTSNLCARECPLPQAERLLADLSTLAADPVACQALGMALSRAVASDFDAERMCRETLALYHRRLSHPVRRRILLCGYFGCGNAGDDAILEGTLSLLQSIDPSVRVTALSAHPLRDRRRFGIRCRFRFSLVSVLCGILTADSIWCGGGSLLQDATSRRSLFYYLGILRLGQLLRRGTVLYSAGIGPLRRAGSQAAVRRVLSDCSYVSLRDPDSELALRSLGVDPALLHLGGDPSVLLPLPPVGRTVQLLARVGIPQNRGLLVLVVKGGEEGETLLPTLITAARLLCARNGLLPVCPIFDRRWDSVVARRAAEALSGHVFPLSESSEAVALMRAASLTLSARLHGMVFSALAETPALGIAGPSSEEKLSAFARRSGEGILSHEELSPIAIVERAEALLSEGDAVRASLRLFLAEERKNAGKDLANLCEMLYNKENDPSHTGRNREEQA